MQNDWRRVKMLMYVLVPFNIAHCLTSVDPQITAVGKEYTAMAGEGVVRDSCHTERFTTNSDGCTVVREGQAEVVFPSREDVFYNPVQEFNRDLSIAVIQAHADEVEVEGGIKILEALAASGLRSVRFAKELRGIESVVANDWSRQAVESITRNVKHNGLDSLVKPHNGDAAMLMYGHRSVCAIF